MIYTQEITLEINSGIAIPTVNAKQSDVDSRALLVHFTQDGIEYKINIKNSVVLRMRKPDGHIIMNDAVVNEDGTVSVIFSYQCLAASGRAYADLFEINADGQLLSSAPFIVNIVPQPKQSPSDILSSDEFLYLKSFVDRGNEYLDKVSKMISSSATYLFFDIDYDSGTLWVYKPNVGSFSEDLNFKLNSTTGNLEVTFNGE